MDSGEGCHSVPKYRVENPPSSAGGGALDAAPGFSCTSSSGTPTESRTRTSTLPCSSTMSTFIFETFDDFLASFASVT